jgi:ABC-type uncharacterized transport system permease subunit
VNNQRTVGVALLVVGVVLLLLGLNASDSAADRWSNFFTGHYTDTTVWYMVVGIGAAVSGLVLTMRRST